MSDYTKTTNFLAKDSLASGHADKVVKGAEHDTEYNNIATAIATKVEKANGAHTGTTTMEDVTLSGTLSGGSLNGGSN